MNILGVNFSHAYDSDEAISEKFAYTLPSRQFSAKSPQLSIASVTVRGKVARNMDGCWIKIWTKSQDQPSLIQWDASKPVTKLSGLVRDIKEKSKNKLNAVLENSSVLKIVPASNVEKYEVSAPLSILLGVPNLQMTEETFGAPDLFRKFRNCLLLCHQLSSNFATSQSEYPVAVPVSLDIDSNGVINSSSIPVNFAQINSLQTSSPLDILTFSLVSSISPQSRLQLNGGLINILGQIIF